ncbi:hypothetical protein BV22DRAFT_125940 [Leucogyrophana mollusca]|uniref:Uncharacterized protein n=1 Tax=Leucogyrophana mollusca TaxID=85980 RepID=A0ACB8BVM3_9AGAM|nr:hypothetical protein BV22DRAFT_125940 [Leucogyrophana mollusca]
MQGAIFNFVIIITQLPVPAGGFFCFHLHSTAKMEPFVTILVWWTCFRLIPFAYNRRSRRGEGESLVSTCRCRNSRYLIRIFVQSAPINFCLKDEFVAPSCFSVSAVSLRNRMRTRKKISVV